MITEINVKIGRAISWIWLGLLFGMGFAGATAFWEVVIYSWTGCPK